MPKAFDEEFGNVLEKMKEHMLSNHLKMIEFTFTDKWHFKLNLPEKDFQKKLRERTLKLYGIKGGKDAARTITEKKK